jgi:hypothetical protein
MSPIDIFEQCLSSAQDNGADDYPELIDQANVHQAGNQRGAANGVHILARVLLQLADLFDVSNDSRVRPRGLVQGLGQNYMRCLVGEVRIVDLALRSDLAREGQSALRIGQDGAPVLRVARIHAAAQNTCIDLREKFKRIFPALYPIKLSVGPLNEAVERRQ